MLGSLFLFIYLLYPAQSHALVKCTVDSPDTWYDYARSVLEAFEEISPGCTDNMAASIPKTWSRGRTVYFCTAWGFIKADSTSSLSKLGNLEIAPLRLIIHDIISMMLEDQVPGKQKSQYYASSWIRQFNEAYYKCENVLDEFRKRNLRNLNEGEDIDGNAIEVFTTLETKIGYDEVIFPYLLVLLGSLFGSCLLFLVPLCYYFMNVLSCMLTLLFLAVLYTGNRKLPASKIGLLNMTKDKNNFGFLLVCIAYFQVLANAIKIYRLYHEDNSC